MFVGTEIESLSVLRICEVRARELEGASGGQSAIHSKLEAQMTQ